MAKAISGSAEEVGATGPELRLCIANEALRQSEILLAVQLSHLAAAESRATSILGWSAAGLTALVAIAFGRQQWPVILPACLLLVSLLSSYRALRPKAWHDVGVTLGKLTEMAKDRELDMKEALALGNEAAADANNAALNRFGKCTRVAWLSLIAAAITGVAEALAWLVWQGLQAAA